MKAQIFLKNRLWSDGCKAGDTVIIKQDDVPEFIRLQLKDGSGNKAVVIEANNGLCERWTREWKEVIL